MLWGGQPVNNQLTGYSPPVNNTLIYANTNNRLHLGIVIPVGDHGLLMVVTSLAVLLVATVSNSKFKRWKLE